MDFDMVYDPCYCLTCLKVHFLTRFLPDCQRVNCPPDFGSESKARGVMCDFNIGKQRAPVEDIPLDCVQVSYAGKGVP